MPKSCMIHTPTGISKTSHSTSVEADASYFDSPGILAIMNTSEGCNPHEALTVELWNSEIIPKPVVWGFLIEGTYVIEGV